MLFSGWVPPMIGRRTACLLGCGFVFLGALYRFSAPVPPTSRSRIFRDFELTPDWQHTRRMDLCASDVSAGAERRICRPLRWRFPAGPFAVDSGLSSRRPPFFASRAPLDAYSTSAPWNSRSMMEDGDDVFNWPWIYAVQVGEWGFTEAQAQNDARIPVARRLLHGRRLSRRRTNGKCS